MRKVSHPPTVDAHDLPDAPSRIRGLLRTSLAISRVIDLDDVLRHVMAGARALVDANAAALTIVHNGGHSRMLHTGLPASTMAAIAAAPHGPHDGARPTLRTPLVGSERLTGSLILTRHVGANRFTRDDHDWVQALAAGAANAIDNAALIAELRREPSWRSAMTDVTTGLFAAAAPDHALPELVRRARQAAAASGACLAVAIEPNTASLDVADGSHTPHLGRRLPIANSVASAAFAANHALVVDDVDDPYVRMLADRSSHQIGPTLVTPILADSDPYGVLILSRPPGAAFDRTDLELAAHFGRQAGVTLHLIRRRVDHERLRLAEDRRDIAEELRHRAIDRLFRLGLALQAMVPRVSGDPVQAAMRAHVDEVDAIIYDIRSTVLSRTLPGPEQSLPQA